MDILATDGYSENTSSTNDKGTLNSKEDTGDKNTEYLIEKIAKNPLIPANTSSPRTTLKGFTESMNLAYQVVMDAHSENKKPPGLFTSESVEKKNNRQKR